MTTRKEICEEIESVLISLEKKEYANATEYETDDYCISVGDKMIELQHDDSNFAFDFAGGAEEAVGIICQELVDLGLIVEVTDVNLKTYL